MPLSTIFQLYCSGSGNQVVKLYNTDLNMVGFRNSKNYVQQFPSYKATPIKGHPSYKATPIKGHSSYKATPIKGHPSSKATPIKGHPSYKATPIKGHPSYRKDFRCTEIVKYY